MSSSYLAVVIVMHTFYMADHFHGNKILKFSLIQDIFKPGVRPWFLEIALTRTSVCGCVCVCVCVCVHPPGH